MNGCNEYDMLRLHEMVSRVSMQGIEFKELATRAEGLSYAINESVDKVHRGSVQSAIQSLDADACAKMHMIEILADELKTCIEDLMNFTQHSLPTAVSSLIAEGSAMGCEQCMACGQEQFRQAFQQLSDNI